MTTSRFLLLFGCVMLIPATGVWAKRPQAKPTQGTPAGSLASLDAKNGFRDVTFGSQPTKDMELLRVDGDQRVYLRPGDSLEVGGAACKQIRYVFHKGQLYAVFLTTEGWRNNRAMHEFLHKAYGPPSVPSEYGGRERWIGNRVVLEYSENQDGGAVTVLKTKAPAEASDQSNKGIAK